MDLTIAKLGQQIRNQINEPSKRDSLLNKPDLIEWNKLCSALDVIGDTELALDAYLEHPEVESLGLRYLFVYGVLQLLQTQQDVAAHLCDSLNIKITSKTKIPSICAIRSTAVAHPASRQENKVFKSGFIEQCSLSHRGFTLLTVYSDGKESNFERVDIPALIQEQRTVLIQALSNIVEELDQEAIG